MKGSVWSRESINVKLAYDLDAAFVSWGQFNKETIQVGPLIFINPYKLKNVINMLEVI